MHQIHSAQDVVYQNRSKAFFKVLEQTNVSQEP